MKRKIPIQITISIDDYEKPQINKIINDYYDQHVEDGDLFIDYEEGDVSLIDFHADETLKEFNAISESLLKLNIYFYQYSHTEDGKRELWEHFPATKDQLEINRTEIVQNVA